MPSIELNTVYNMVFGDWARPRPIPDTLTAEQKARIAAKEEQRKNEFEFIKNNPALSRQFRSLLREIPNAELETSLYGNNTDTIAGIPLKYKLPTDEEIKAQFQKLEGEYQYFTADKNAADLFVKLFKASKFIADYAEENNSDDNSVAYLHAYKLMVLFSINQQKPFERIDQFIKANMQHFNYLLHDLLVLPIPKNNPPLHHLKEWQDLIFKHGPSVLSLFQQSAAIEKILDEQKTPLTLASIRQAAAQLSYKKASENPALAQLCQQYNVTEPDFNHCLTIKPKQTDQLPNAVVDGSDVGHQGYYLVKLPVNDPRAYILGHITNCCQSIGGDSEQCVIDGITRDKNGFYVLLQAKSGAKSTTTPPIPIHDNGQINYDGFEIVGQGYAWLSQLNNLTFDSWENRNPNPDDIVIEAMLPKFAAQCFAQNPGIGRVTIGLVLQL